MRSARLKPKRKQKAYQQISTFFTPYFEALLFNFYGEKETGSKVTRYLYTLF